jgi:lipopolysaccharide export system permease protein
MSTIFKYIGKEFILSFVVAFLFFFAIFFVNNLLVIAMRLIQKNVEVMDVVRMLIYLMPLALYLPFPFASLVGGLMAMGRLSADNEIISLQASGVHPSKIFMPMFLASIIFATIAFVSGDILLPMGYIEFRKTFTRVFAANPELELNSFTINKYDDGKRIMVPGRVSGNRIENLIIIDQDSRNGKRFIAADEAIITANADEGDVISLTLDNIYSLTQDRSKSQDWEVIRADSMEYNLNLSNANAGSSGVSITDMSSIDIKREIDKRKERLDQRQLDQSLEIQRRKIEAWKLYYTDFATQPLEEKVRSIAQLESQPIRDRSMHIYLVEWYLKFAIPFGAICFVFLAFPAGMLNVRSGRMVGFIIGLILSVAYWGFIYGGKYISARILLDPFLSTWMGNIIVLIVGISLMVVRFKR